MDIPQGLVPERPDEHWHVERYLHGEFVHRECHLTSLHVISHIVDYCALRPEYTFLVEVVKDGACSNDMLNHRKRMREQAERDGSGTRGHSPHHQRAIYNYRAGMLCRQYVNGLLAASFGE